MADENPRQSCLRALQQWESSRTFADDVLHRTLDGSQLTTVNRAFVTEAFYGVIRNRSLLDFVIERFRPSKLDSRTRLVLQLGLYQLYKMRVAPHAAVYETVNLAGPARSLVNAILRRAINEKEAVLSDVQSAPAYIRWSHPEFLYSRWSEEHGSGAAEGLCQWNNEPAKIYVRTNQLRSTKEALLENADGAKLSPLNAWKSIICPAIGSQPVWSTFRIQALCWPAKCSIRARERRCWMRAPLLVAKPAIWPNSWPILDPCWPAIMNRRGWLGCGKTWPGSEFATPPL